MTFAPCISEKRYEEPTTEHGFSLVRGDNRPLSEKTLAALRFLLENVDEDGNRPSWAELTRIWNREHPERRFRGRGGLRKAYQRAVEELAGVPMPGQSSLQIAEWRERRADSEA